VVTESVADGIDHSLDPRVIPLERITGGIFVAVFALASLIVVIIRLFGDADWPRYLLPVLWVTLVPLWMWHAYTWPPRAWRHTFYKVDEQGIEIRRGVWWRVMSNVPKSRVQHIDVSQGPFERRFGLGTLVVYTAGTEHAKVELGGLEHGRALAIREHLLPSGASDAV
jgi:membrane protein YdbS with pleckstrin-like domain